MSRRGRGGRWVRMPLRGRVVLLTSLAVSIAVVGAAAAAWFTTRHQLIEQLDDTLRNTAPGQHQPAETHISIQGALPGPGPQPGSVPTPSQLPSSIATTPGATTPGVTGPGGTTTAPGGTVTPGSTGSTGGTTLRDPSAICRDQRPLPIGQRFLYTVQVQYADGTVCALPGSTRLVADSTDIAVANGSPHEAFHNGTDADGTAMRIFAEQVSPGVALLTARPLAEVNASLHTLGWLLLAVALGGLLVAAVAGLLIARACLAPVDRLTQTVEHVARTEDLDVEVPAVGRDEVARLGRAFTTMTRALALSRERQRQLIADAGHELRTPLTSLRTNVDLLRRSAATGRALPARAHGRVLTALDEQLHELTDLVGDLLELARPSDAARSRAELPRDVPLHQVLDHAVRRARLRGPDHEIAVAAQPWFVRANPASLERAVMNLLDNAVKFSPPGGRIDVELREGVLTVQDRGPGVSEDDLPHVFDRFWRSSAARGLPGSGLGLAIVARVAQDAGGAVALENAPGGGTVAELRLPGTRHVRGRGTDQPTAEGTADTADDSTADDSTADDSTADGDTADGDTADDAEGDAQRGRADHTADRATGGGAPGEAPRDAPTR